MKKSARKCTGAHAQVQRPRLHELLHSLLGIPPPDQAWLSSLRAQTWLVAALKASRRAETLNDVDLDFQRTGWVVHALAMPGPWTWVGEVGGPPTTITLSVERPTEINPYPGGRQC